MISRKNKKVCTTLNYIEYFLILASGITGSVSNSAFVSLFGITIRITSSKIRLKICTIAAGIKTCKSIIKKKKKKGWGNENSIVKAKLNSTGVLICKALIDLNISHDQFVLTNNVLKQYDDMKQEIKNLKS